MFILWFVYNSIIFFMSFFLNVAILSQKKWVVLVAPLFESRADFTIFVATVTIVKAMV
jgi:hypothetical protein